MNTIETRRYEMLVKVRDFGRAHGDLFPTSSPGGNAFAAVEAAVTELGRHAVMKMSSQGAARDGGERREAARTAVREQIDAISRTAGLMAEDKPDLAERFRMPKARNDQALLTCRAPVRARERGGRGRVSRAPGGSEHRGPTVRTRAARSRRGEGRTDGGTSGHQRRARIGHRRRGKPGRHHRQPPARRCGDDGRVGAGTAGEVSEERSERRGADSGTRGYLTRRGRGYIMTTHHDVHVVTEPDGTG